MNATDNGGSGVLTVTGDIETPQINYNNAINNNPIPINPFTDSGSTPYQVYSKSYYGFNGTILITLTGAGAGGGGGGNATLIYDGAGGGGGGSGATLQLQIATGSLEIIQNLIITIILGNPGSGGGVSYPGNSPSSHTSINININGINYGCQDNYPGAGSGAYSHDAYGTGGSGALQFYQPSDGRYISVLSSSSPGIDGANGSNSGSGNGVGGPGGYNTNGYGNGGQGGNGTQDNPATPGSNGGNPYFQFNLVNGSYQDPPYSYVFPSTTYINNLTAPSITSNTETLDLGINGLFLRINGNTNSFYPGPGYGGITALGDPDLGQWSNIYANSKSFVIPHPDPSKCDTHLLRHNCVEAPTRGDNLYRWTITTTNKTYVQTIPSYSCFLNGCWQFFVNSINSFGVGYVTLAPDESSFTVTVSEDGTYNVLGIATRKDAYAKDFDRTGVEWEKSKCSL